MAVLNNKCNKPAFVRAAKIFLGLQKIFCELYPSWKNQAGVSRWEIQLDYRANCPSVKSSWIFIWKNKLEKTSWKPNWSWKKNVERFLKVSYFLIMKIRAVLYILYMNIYEGSNFSPMEVNSPFRFNFRIFNEHINILHTLFVTIFTIFDDFLFRTKPLSISLISDFIRLLWILFNKFLCYFFTELNLINTLTCISYVMAKCY